ncbi:MAG TPA: glycosyltransferase family 9 protein [Bryobacteraceae bacterium]|nr:glycosyltransferase family 9 protein [Bryobacteraceae bacterium]
MPAAAHPGRDGPARNPLKRLLIRPGAIGDCVISLPALEFLRAGYTEVWAPSRTLPLIRFADRVRSLVATGIDLVGITEPALAAFIEFDSITSWYGTNRTEFRDAVAHLPFTFYPALPDGRCHAVDFFMRQVGGPDGAVPRIECARADGGFVAVHPFSGSESKNWPLAAFEKLAAELPLPVSFCVSPEQHYPGAVQMDDLYQLACWLASARVYVGNDSGITHLAAAVGTPVVALFGPTDPAVWAPRSAAVIRGQPMSGIGVQAVRDAVMAQIQAR